VARHVDWLASLAQARVSHHTAPRAAVEKDTAALADLRAEVSALKSKLADMEKLLAAVVLPAAESFVVKEPAAPQEVPVSSGGCGSLAGEQSKEVEGASTVVGEFTYGTEGSSTASWSAVPFWYQHFPSEARAKLREIAKANIEFQKVAQVVESVSRFEGRWRPPRRQWPPSPSSLLLDEFGRLLSRSFG